MYDCKIEKNYSRAACELAAFARIPERAPLAFPAPADAKPLTSCFANNWWRPPIEGEPYIDMVPGWLSRALARTARRYLRRSPAPWAVDVVGITTDGTVVVHVYACSRSAQRRMAKIASGLAKALTRTARASNMIGELGTGRIVLSWGWSPRALADEARRKAYAERPSPSPLPPEPPEPRYVKSEHFGWSYLLPAA